MTNFFFTFDSYGYPVGCQTAYLRKLLELHKVRDPPQASLNADLPPDGPHLLFLHLQWVSKIIIRPSFVAHLRTQVLEL